MISQAAVHASITRLYQTKKALKKHIRLIQGEAGPFHFHITSVLASNHSIMGAEQIDQREAINPAHEVPVAAVPMRVAKAFSSANQQRACAYSPMPARSPALVCV